MCAGSEPGKTVARARRGNKIVPGERGSRNGGPSRPRSWRAPGRWCEKPPGDLADRKRGARRTLLRRELPEVATLADNGGSHAPAVGAVAERDEAGRMQSLGELSPLEGMRTAKGHAQAWTSEAGAPSPASACHTRASHHPTTPRTRRAYSPSPDSLLRVGGVIETRGPIHPGRKTGHSRRCSFGRTLRERGFRAGPARGTRQGP